MILYGIKNCDTVRKARAWLDNNKIRYHFHDFRENTLEKTRLHYWLEQAGHEALINKKSATYRQLNDTQKTVLASTHTLQLLLEYPTLIKRPVLEKQNGAILIGFTEKEYREKLLLAR